MKTGCDRFWSHPLQKCQCWSNRAIFKAEERGRGEMAIFIRKSEKSRLFSANLFLKSVPLKRRLKVSKAVLQNLKLKKPLPEGLFQRRDSSISRNGTPLGLGPLHQLAHKHSSISRNGTPLGLPPTGNASASDSSISRNGTPLGLWRYRNGSRIDSSISRNGTPLGLLPLRYR